MLPVGALALASGGGRSIASHRAVAYTLALVFNHHWFVMPTSVS